MNKVRKIIVNSVRKITRPLGFDIVRFYENKPYPPDFQERNKIVCDAVKNYTMTSPERVNALVNAVAYVVKNNIEGAMVECGVWKGGSSMAIAMSLLDLGEETRDLDRKSVV